LPLNDDAGERSARLHSRQAQQDEQMNQIKAAAKTPLPPRRKSGLYSMNEPPTTPSNAAHRRASGVRGHAGGRKSMGGSGGGANGGFDVSGTAVTPMKRVPILANFEEWMKMATDNKINANNSWNFALIDYFHDMSLLKEGDGVNFQKASCTLDGCVKIYTSRVDSVATETGKLLSGLADSNAEKVARKGQADGEGGDADDDAGGEGGDDDEDDESGKKKSKKRTRVHEATLAPSFASLQLKRMELELAVDPLFKKASADFDEGGARGLLLNNLSINGEGRIVFDSSDDAADAAKRNDEKQQDEQEEADAAGIDDHESSPVDVDIGSLARRFFPDMSLLAEQTVCPSLKDFDLGDPNGSLNIPFLQNSDAWKQEGHSDAGAGYADPSGIMLDDDMALGFDHDDDATITGLDLGGEIGFGQGGEVWAREAALEGGGHGLIGVAGTDAGDTTAVGSDEGDTYAMSLSLGNLSAAQEQESILSYFDNALKKNWSGPEHWKIKKIKDTTAGHGSADGPKAAKRAEKEAFRIQFGEDLDPAAAALIYTPAASNAAISMPKTQWKTKGRNLLPDDKHFNSRQLLRLFLKPRARMGFERRRATAGAGTVAGLSQLPNSTNIDENFWANQKNPADAAAEEEGANQGAYDANFFADDDGGLPDDADADADGGPVSFDDNVSDEMASGDATVGGTTGLATLLSQGGVPESQGFGSQLVTQGGRRVRPEYIAYAKTAKKVDVRRLKETMWKEMGEKLPDSLPARLPAADADSLERRKENEPPNSPAPSPSPAAPTPARDERAENNNDLDTSALRFTAVMNDLKTSYNEPALKEISTSYCFICLLHLANEKGLVLKNKAQLGGGIEEWTDGAGGLDEIFVAKDTAVAVDDADAELPYRVFKCEWAGCRAQLHNLATLTRHLERVHLARRRVECRWRECYARRRRDDGEATQGTMEETKRKKREKLPPSVMMRHIKKAHLYTVAMALGDGPTRVGWDHYEAVRAAIENESFLRDSRGRLVTPRAVVDEEKPPALIFAAPPMAVQDFSAMHGYNTRERRCQAVIDALAAKKISAGITLTQEGCNFMNPSRYRTATFEVVEEVVEVGA
ncbi:hypothetical protein KEM52_000907, partial [Ascosphaera acerosa]